MKDVVRERRERWIAALRSGDYERGHGALKRDGKYCCLGVACEVYRQMTGKGSWEQKSEEDTVFKAEDDLEAKSFLPIEVSQFFGINSRGAHFHFTVSKGERQFGCLTSMNDSGLFTFADIADFIESNPEVF